MTDPFAMKSYELGPLSSIRQGLLGTWTTKNLAVSHKFLFGFHTDVPDSFCHFGENLVSRGIFRLPFQFTVMEFLCGRGLDDPIMDRLVLLCEQVMMDENTDTPPIIVLIFPLVRSKNGVWTPIQYGGDPVLIGTGRPTAAGAPVYRIPQEYLDREGWRKIANAALTLCPAATAMMMSRSINVDKVEIPSAVAKARAKRGQPGLFHFHVVRVPAVPRNRASLNPSDQVRRPPMLHWRRGHYRRISLDKIVPVAPCLVGAQDIGIIAKDYDGREMPSAPVKGSS